MNTSIYRLGEEEPIRFAAAEFQKYWKRMTGKSLTIRKAALYSRRQMGVWIGISERFGNYVPNLALPARDVFDDAIFVSSRPSRVLIAGSNARSVLFATYRYLEELGCRWLRPGPHGERVPRLVAPSRKTVRLLEIPSLRHRALAMEGSLSERHVIDMIDYAAKRGFNAYKLQLRDAYLNLNRWYWLESRKGAATPGRLRSREAHRYYVEAKRELRKRGLIIESMGHGWTTWAVGISSRDWIPYRGKLPASSQRYLAKINGKRQLHHNQPLNTNLCTSNSRARAMLARKVTDYAHAHPDEQVIHVWLADGANNTCECARCCKARPSDFYVSVLNEIDERLSQKGLPTRIVFLAYADLLWAPQKERFRNAERFILMFAPITRSFSRAFLDQTGGDERVRPYVRNRLSFPTTPGGNLKMLAPWRKVFPGECVDYDYHLWRDHVRDPGQMAVLPVLFKDARDLQKLAMVGYIGCSTQRIAFPTGILLHALGKTLWNNRQSFRTLVSEYLSAAFGARAAEVRDYLEQISSAFDPVFLRGEKRHAASRRAALKKLAGIRRLAMDFLPVVEQGRRSKDPVTAASWKILREHSWYVQALAELYEAAFAGEATGAGYLYDKLCKELDRRLPRLHHVFDTWRARGVIRQVLDLANALR